MNTICVFIKKIARTTQTKKISKNLPKQKSRNPLCIKGFWDFLVLSSIFRKFVSDKMKSRAGIRRWSGYAPLNCLKAYAGGGVKSGEAVHLDS